MFSSVPIEQLGDVERMTTATLVEFAREAAETRTGVTVDGHDVTYSVVGASALDSDIEPIVMMDGTNTSSTAPSQIYKAAHLADATQRPIITLDSLGNGGSSPITAAMIAEGARWRRMRLHAGVMIGGLQFALKNLRANDENVHMVGNSADALLAVEMGLIDPRRYQTLSLEEPTATSNMPTRQYARNYSEENKERKRLFGSMLTHSGHKGDTSPFKRFKEAIEVELGIVDRSRSEFISTNWKSIGLNLTRSPHASDVMQTLLPDFMSISRCDVHLIHGNASLMSPQIPVLQLATELMNRFSNHRVLLTSREGEPHDTANVHLAPRNSADIARGIEYFTHWAH